MPDSSNSFATIPAPLFRSCSSVNSSTGVCIGSYPARANRSSKSDSSAASRANSAGQHVARASDGVDRSFGHALGLDGVHEPSPFASAALTVATRSDQGIALSFLAGGEVAEVEDLFGLFVRPTITASLWPRVEPYPICLPIWIGSG